MGPKKATFRRVTIFLIGFFRRRFIEHVVNYLIFNFERGHMREKEVILG